MWFPISHVVVRRRNVIENILFSSHGPYSCTHCGCSLNEHHPSSHINHTPRRLFKKVLITKLRSANTVETRQYRKASKALLVLIPLLGITYLVVMAGPNEGVGLHIFAIARALLLSTQVNILILTNTYIL